jgi:hypothetical protein
LGGGGRTRRAAPIGEQDDDGFGGGQELAARSACDGVFGGEAGIRHDPMQQPFPKFASLVHWHGRSATIGVFEDGMAAALAHKNEAVSTE